MITEDLKASLTRQTSELVYEILRWSFGRFLPAGSRAAARWRSRPRSASTVDGILMEGFRRVDEWHLIERGVDNFDVVFLRNDDTIQQMGRGASRARSSPCSSWSTARTPSRTSSARAGWAPSSVSKMLYRLLSIKLIRKRVAPVAV